MNLESIKANLIDNVNSEQKLYIYSLDSATYHNVRQTLVGVRKAVRQPIVIAWAYGYLKPHELWWHLYEWPRCVEFAYSVFKERTHEISTSEAVSLFEEAFKDTSLIEQRPDFARASVSYS